MARNRAPIDNDSLMRCGAELCRRHEGKLWSDIDPTERVLMAYANPRAAWRASDGLDLLDFAL